MIDLDTRKLSSATSVILEYVCGLIWLADIALLTSRAQRADELARFLQRGVTNIATIRAPDLVVTYTAAVIGLILPYAAAMIFRPLSVLMSNRVLPFIRNRFVVDQVSPEHRQLVEQQVQTDLQMSIPGWWAFFLELYIDQTSQTAPESVRASYNRAQGLMQSALPVAVFCGLVVSLLNRSTINAVAGVIVGGVAYFILIKAAVEAHMRWDNGIIFSYLIQRNREQTPHPDEVAESHTPVLRRVRPNRCHRELVDRNADRSNCCRRFGCS
jgi:hypothetical protein